MLREYRPEHEVFSDENIEALKTSPVTNGHPPEMVTPQNSKKYMVGFPTRTVEQIKDTVYDEKYLKTWLTITDQDAINAINAGKAQISNGYNVNLEFTPGHYKGEKYDAIQKDIVNNHIAIVWQARGGPNVRLHMDEGDAEFYEDAREMIQRPNPHGEKIIFGSPRDSEVFDLDEWNEYMDAAKRINACAPNRFSDEIIKMMGGTPSDKKTWDGGIDGKVNGVAVQVKKCPGMGLRDIGIFKKQLKGKRGIFVAKSFTNTSADFAKKAGITLKTHEDIIKGRKRKDDMEFIETLEFEKKDADVTLFF